MAQFDMSSLMGLSPGYNQQGALPMSPTANAGTAAGATGGGMDFSSLFGGGGGDMGGMLGGVSSALGAVGGIMGAVNAGKQLKLAEDMYGFQKDAYNQDSANQATMVNNQLEDRQIAREGYSGQSKNDARYGTIESYMDKNSVSTTKL